nr:FtsX-like permease family protein [Streptomyces sp. SID3343]
MAGLRERGTALAGSLVALSVGAAILTASVLVLLTGGSGVPARYAGTPVLVHSSQGAVADGEFAEPAPWSPERTAELTRALAALPGVRTAVADRSFYAQDLLAEHQAKGERQGHGWSSATLAPYRLTAGRAPHDPGEVVLDEALGRHPGDTVTLLTALGPAPYTVSGTVDGPGYYVTDDAARALAGGVRTIGVHLAPGAAPHEIAAAARALAPDASVLTGDARDRLAPAADARTAWIGAQVITAMAALAGFAVILVVAATFAFGVTTRHRELALLRTIGATPTQVRRSLYREASVLGALGSAAGVAIGASAASALARVLVDAGFEPAGFTVHVRAWILAATFAAGVLTALAAVWSASRRAARINPLDALREAAVDERPMSRARGGVGIACIAVGIGCAAASAFAAPADMVTWALGTAATLITGATLLTPALVAPLARAVTRPLAHRAGATALLVRENTCTAVRRTASTVAPVLATVGFVVLITGNTQTTANAFTDHATATVRAHGAVVGQGTPGLSDAAVTAVDGSALLTGTGYAGPAATATAIVGIDPATFAAAHDRLDVVAGSLADLRTPDTVALTETTLAGLGRRPGDTVEFTFEDGRTPTLRIAAVLTDRSVPYGALVAHDTLRAHDPSALTDVVYRTGAAPANLPAGLGAVEIAVTTYAGRADADEDHLVAVFTLLMVAMSAGYTGLAVANTLLMASAGRVTDFRVLRRSGATRRQVLWSVAGETTFTVALGAVLGGLVAVPSLLGIRAGLEGSLGVPVDLVLPWAPVTAAVGACLALALAASVLPAHRAMRASTTTA